MNLDHPVAADSDGTCTAVADAGARRVLILDKEGKLTGVISCDSVDCPIDAVTDIAVVGDQVYVAGSKFAPDSSLSERERVLVYETDGTLKGTAYEVKGESLGEFAISGLDCAEKGAIAIVEKRAFNAETGEGSSTLTSHLVSLEETRELGQTKPLSLFARDAAYSEKSSRFVVLDCMGALQQGDETEARLFKSHLFTAMDVDGEGTVYACDDKTKGLCTISQEGEVKDLVSGAGFSDVHVSGSCVTACSQEGNTVKTFAADGSAKLDLSSVSPTTGYSLRILLIGLCWLYLGTLFVVLVVRKMVKALKSGQLEAFGTIVSSVAIVFALGAAIYTFMNITYESSLETRTQEIGLCADYLSGESALLGTTSEAVGNRDAWRSSDKKKEPARNAFLEVCSSTYGRLVDSANKNKIGVYFTVYGRDDKGTFYILDSGLENVVGTSVAAKEKSDALEKAFADPGSVGDKAQVGRTTLDNTIYRLIPVAASDGSGTVVVVEVGSRMQSFLSMVLGRVGDYLLGFVVTMLVVYLLYKEVRGAGRSLFRYRQLVQEDRACDAIAALTRPLTFCITLLSRIDSVMSVLVARELLKASGMEKAAPLVALPAVILGIGMAIARCSMGA